MVILFSLSSTTFHLINSPFTFYLLLSIILLLFNYLCFPFTIHKLFSLFDWAGQQTHNQLRESINLWLMRAAPVKAKREKKRKRRSKHNSNQSTNKKKVDWWNCFVCIGVKLREEKPNFFSLIGWGTNQERKESLFVLLSRGEIQQIKRKSFFDLWKEQGNQFFSLSSTN